MNTGKGNGRGRRAGREDEWETIEEYEARMSGVPEYSEDSADTEEDIDALEFVEEYRPNDTISMSARKTLVFCGLLVLAVLICIPLWSLTHKKLNRNPDAESPESIDVTDDETPDEDMPNDDGAPGSEPGAEQPDAPSEGTNPDDATSSDGEAGSGTLEAGAEDGDASMKFTAADDTVTAKDVTNLRFEPSTASKDNIVGQLKNGASLKRTGLNADTGWSRLEYNGETVYAVTRYLTTDLSYEKPDTPANPNTVATQDGRTITFTDCDDYITPKEYVNLRTEPSTSQGNDTISCRLNYGEQAHRTGISAESGWSRVEYDNKVLYVVTSYITEAASETAE